MNEQKKAYRKVLRVFRHYRRKALGSYSGKEIWEACGRIHFYCCVKEYFQYNPEIPQGYLCLILAIPKPIESMWQFYLKHESTEYLTWEGLEALLEGMLLAWELPQAG